MPDTINVLFTPFITVKIGGTAGQPVVVGVDVDWSDACQGEFVPPASPQGMSEGTPAERVACALLDNPDVREQVKAALLSGIAHPVERAIALLNAADWPSVADDLDELFDHDCDPIEPCETVLNRLHDIGEGDSLAAEIVENAIKEVERNTR